MHRPHPPRRSLLLSISQARQASQSYSLNTLEEAQHTRGCLNAVEFPHHIRLFPIQKPSWLAATGGSPEQSVAYLNSLPSVQPSCRGTVSEQVMLWPSRSPPASQDWNLAAIPQGGEARTLHHQPQQLPSLPPAETELGVSFSLATRNV